MELIVASNNEGKILEYKNILTLLGINVRSQKERGVLIDVPETGSSFEENAVLKAKVVYDITHYPVIADDSGLEVEALHGEPGIYSARYKGLSSMHLRRMAVLDELRSETNRNARFVTCICYINVAGIQHIFTGVWNGVIANKEEGTNGFGYDSIFVPEESAYATVASMPLSFKEKYSHRAKAIAQFLTHLKKESM